MNFARRHPRIERVFRLSVHKGLLIIAAFLVAAVMHNLVYAAISVLWGPQIVAAFGPDWDEPFFFIIAVQCIPLYAIAAIAYSLFVRKP